MNKGDKYTPELIGRHGEILKSVSSTFYFAAFVDENNLSTKLVDNNFWDKNLPRIKIIIKGVSYDSYGKNYYFFSIDPNQDFAKLTILKERRDDENDWKVMKKSDLINRVFIIDMKYVNLI